MTIVRTLMDAIPGRFDPYSPFASAAWSADLAT